MKTDEIIKEHFNITENEKVFYAVKPAAGRIELHKCMAKLGFKTGVEIGVNQARHAVFLLDNIPGLMLYAVDPWMAYYRHNQPRQDRYYKIAKKALLGKNCKILKKTSMQAVGEFADGSLDFVYIDGDHVFDSTMSDLIMWSPKVKIGGIVAGHDYGVHFANDVIVAVNAYVKAHNISPWYLIREKAGTYFWVKKNND